MFCEKESFSGKEKKYPGAGGQTPVTSHNKHYEPFLVDPERFKVNGKAKSFARDLKW